MQFEHPYLCGTVFFSETQSDLVRILTCRIHLDRYPDTGSCSTLVANSHCFGKPWCIAVAQKNICKIFVIPLSADFTERTEFKSCAVSSFSHLHETHGFTVEYSRGGRSHIFRLRLCSCYKICETGSGSETFSIWESDSCSDCGYHQYNRNTAIFLLKKWYVWRARRLLLLPKI